MLLGTAVMPAEMQSSILERAGGNPLYAEEFVRLLRDQGLVVKKGRTLALVEHAEIALPESLQALIDARLDTLVPERKAMLQDAAVMGKVFWSGALAMMGNVERKAVVAAMHELSRKELVGPARLSSMAGEDEYSFMHMLIRDVTYAQIPRAGRMEKHRRAAAWIESVGGERLGDLADVIAHHYTAARALAQATGDARAARELEDPARRFLLLAGERALGLDATKAEANLARALELTPRGHPATPTRPRPLGRSRARHRTHRRGGGCSRGGCSYLSRARGAARGGARPDHPGERAMAGGG
jgi:predicted ATPase